MQELDAKEFVKRIAVVLNERIGTSRTTKAETARAIGVSEQYLTQITNSENKYRKPPITEERLRAIIRFVKSHSPENNIEEEVERILRTYKNKKYRMVYHLLKLNESLNDVETVIEKLDDIYNESIGSQ